MKGPVWKTLDLFFLEYFDEYEQHACNAGEIAQGSEPKDGCAADVGNGMDKASHEENLRASDRHLCVDVGHMGGSSYGDVEHEVFK